MTEPGRNCLLDGLAANQAGVTAERIGEEELNDLP